MSRWLLHDTEQSLAPMFLFQTNPILIAPWHYFSNCVKEGGIAFKKAHGCEIFEMASKDDELNKIFNNGMKSVTRCIMKTIVKRYKDGFNSITSLVDVGGGIGAAMTEIVKAYPHIKGINFDLPHVVSTAQKYDGVEHVGGDMFEAIPPADAVFMKVKLIYVTVFDRVTRNIKKKSKWSKIYLNYHFILTITYFPFFISTITIYVLNHTSNISCFFFFLYLIYHHNSGRKRKQQIVGSVFTT